MNSDIWFKISVSTSHQSHIVIGWSNDIFLNFLFYESKKDPYQIKQSNITQ